MTSDDILFNPYLQEFQIVIFINERRETLKQ